MELFTRRPFLFSCFLFIVFSLLSYVYGLGILFLFVLSLFAIISILFAVFLKKHRSKFLLSLTCIIFAIAGVLNVVFRVDLKLQKAEEIIGEGVIEAVVISEVSENDYYSEYSVRLKYASGEKVNIKSTLLTYFNCDLEAGDRIYAIAKIDYVDSSKLGTTYKNLNKDTDMYITTVVSNASDMRIYPDSVEYPLFSAEWFEDKFISINKDLEKLKVAIYERLVGFSDEKSGSLAYGFLTGDTEHIETNTIRDFRRTGLSHILAVSGLHVSILLGSIEVLLRLFCVDKKIRIAIITPLSVGLLAISGFSESAVRSVFMLMYIYLAFLFSEENDSPTSLFASGAIIVLLSPHSLSDIGFWMSFMATLGIVTFYSFYQRSIHEKSKDTVKRHKWLKIPRYILYTILITLTSNLFIAFIFYMCFGEIAVIAPLSNLLISPIAYIFLIAIPILLLLGGIPVLGEAIGFVISFLSEVIIFIASKLSHINFASISLRYDFTPYIIWSVTAITAIFLTIRLKHKWLTITPVICGIVAFTVCIVVFNNTYGKPILNCYGNDEEKILVISEKSEASVYIDSVAYYNDYIKLNNDAKKYGATEFETLIVGNLSEIHIPSLQYFLNNSIVRNVYFPLPENNEETQKAVSIAYFCHKNSIQSAMIQEGDIIAFSDSVNVIIDYHDANESSYPEITFISDIGALHYKNGIIFNNDYSKEFHLDKDIKIKLYSTEDK